LKGRERWKVRTKKGRKKHRSQRKGEEGEDEEEEGGRWR